MTDFNSLLVGGYTPWHTGDDVITYSFLSGLASTLPSYYERIDTDEDGIVDSIVRKPFSRLTVPSPKGTVTRFSTRGGER